MSGLIVINLHIQGALHERELMDSVWEDASHNRNDLPGGHYCHFDSESHEIPEWELQILEDAGLIKKEEYYHV